MRHVHLLDTSVASDNVGDEIIVSEARRYVEDRFGDAYITSSSSHDSMGHYGRKLANNADLVLLLGTNALTAKYQRRGHFVWSVGRRDIAALEGKVVLLGVGANTANADVTPRQSRLLQRLLSRDFQHSVRDETAKVMLQQIGRPVLNTSCPTLWRYSADMPAIPTGCAPAVCFTLTKHKSSDHDVTLIESLRKCYQKLYFWPQQMRDLPYLRTLTDMTDVEVIPANLKAYDKLLASTDIDVVGTRLHGGIRGLSHKRRTLVVAIDNRAQDIGREVGLPTQPRDALGDELVERLRSGFVTQLTLPHDNIDKFLAQFTIT